MAHTRKRSSLPGGWLPLIQPHIAATPISLKVAQSFARLPTRIKWDQLVPIGALVCPDQPLAVWPLRRCTGNAGHSCACKQIVGGAPYRTA